MCYNIIVLPHLAQLEIQLELNSCISLFASWATKCLYYLPEARSVWKVLKVCLKVCLGGV